MTQPRKNEVAPSHVAALLVFFFSLLVCHEKNAPIIIRVLNEMQDCTQAVREIFVEGETDLGLACEEIMDMVMSPALSCRRRRLQLL